LDSPAGFVTFARAKVKEERMILKIRGILRFLRMTVCGGMTECLLRSMLRSKH